MTIEREKIAAPPSGARDDRRALTERRRTGSGQRLLTVQEAARYLGTTPGRIYNLISVRMIPSVKIGASRRLDVLVLDKWIRERTDEALPSRQVGGRIGP